MGGYIVIIYFTGRYCLLLAPSKLQSSHMFSMSTSHLPHVSRRSSDNIQELLEKDFTDAQPGCRALNAMIQLV